MYAFNKYESFYISSRNCLHFKEWRMHSIVDISDHRSQPLFDVVIMRVLQTLVMKQIYLDSIIEG